MEILQSYEFRRPSKSRYAKVVDALLEGVDGKPVFAIKLKRGEDFPADASISSVQGAISTQIRESDKNVAKRRARTWVEDPETANVLIVSLWPEGEGPKPRAKRPARRQSIPH